MAFTNKQPDFGLTVYEHNHKNFESMMRKFKKRIQDSGILDEYKERQYFNKPSDVKRAKRKKAKFNAAVAAKQ